MINSKIFLVFAATEVFNEKDSGIAPADGASCL